MSTSLTPWETWGTTLTFRSKDVQFWWDRLGRMFAKLLESAGYTIDEQYRELHFFALFVATQMGPAPDESFPWQLLRTPDQTPIDFSWEWFSDRHAVLRYAFEPILPAGTNVNHMRNPTQVWLETMHKQGLIPGLDLEWFHHFVSTMVPPGMTHKGFGEQFYGRSVPVFGTSLAVDIRKTGKAVKAYFWPSLNAKVLGISDLECIKKAIRALPTEQFEDLQAEPVFEFLQDAIEKWGLKPFLFSIDCVKPKEARIKIYVAGSWTSREFLMDSLTMGGRLPTPEESTMASMTALWDTFLGDAPDKLPDEVAAKSTPGFYLTLGSGGKKSVKMYMSPQHWCTTDGEVITRLREYFGSQQQSDYLVGRYESAVRQILGSAIVDGRIGSHFYIGTEPSKGRPRVVTYLSPQTYLIERSQIQSAAAPSDAQSHPPQASVEDQQIE